ncbi:enoyl-CoA hydratase [Bacillus sp. F19]|nr:enoyl-CoA hydratase [Bacillus sp. F19]
MKLNLGDIFTWERTFTAEETLQFAELPGDKGRHHLEHDEKGRLMVHGLMTASIGTKIGGDLNYIAREMTSEFIWPVFTGDAITCISILKKMRQSVSMEQKNRLQPEKKASKRVYGTEKSSPA